MGAVIGIGVAVQMETAPASGTYQSIAFVKGEPSFGFSRKTFDKTHHGSTDRYMEFGKGLKEMTPLSFEAWSDFADASQTSSTGLLEELNEDTDIRNWRFLFPDGEYIQFAGIMTKFELSNPLEDGRMISCEIQPTGAPTFSGI